jgi:uncharacterized protein YhbP (UPF0306 family)
MHEPVSERRIRASLFRILARTQLSSIATVAHEKQAYINTAFIAYSTNLEFYFLSDPESQHCRNLSSNPSLAMTIFDSSQRWENQGVGVQVFGVGRRAVGRQADLARKVYGTRFAAFERWIESQTSQGHRRAALLKSYTFFRFLPDRVKILDEAQFGGAVFVVAKIERSRTTAGSRGTSLRWQKTEVLVPE